MNDEQNAEETLRAFIFSVLMETEPCQRGSYLETLHGALANALAGRLVDNFEIAIEPKR